MEREEKGEPGDVVSVRFGQVDDDQRRERETFDEVCAEAVQTRTSSVGEESGCPSDVGPA